MWKVLKHRLWTILLLHQEYSFVLKLTKWLEERSFIATLSRQHSFGDDFALIEIPSDRYFAFLYLSIVFYFHFLPVILLMMFSLFLNLIESNADPCKPHKTKHIFCITLMILSRCLWFLFHVFFLSSFFWQLWSVGCAGYTDLGCFWQMHLVRNLGSNFF